MGGNGALRASLHSTRIAFFTPWSSEAIRAYKQEEGRLVRAELWSDDVTHVSNALSRYKGTRTTAARKQATEGISFGCEATHSLLVTGTRQNVSCTTQHNSHTSHGSLLALGTHSCLRFSTENIEIISTGAHQLFQMLKSSWWCQSIS